MFTKLERYVYSTVTILALCAAVLVASSTAAQAQAVSPAEDAQGADRDAEIARVVVVDPGDSMWSIGSERLSPDATPQRIAAVAERIYMLNRDRIGPDPNLLFPGQELSMPAVGEPSAAPATQETTGPAQVDRRDRAAEAPGPMVEKPANLPNVPAAVPVPAVSSAALTAPPGKPAAFLPETVRSSVASAVSAVVEGFAKLRATADERQLLGLGIIALTVLVGGLMAWKLPMKRNVGESMLLGIYSGYSTGGYYAYTEHAYREQILNLYRDKAASALVTSGPKLIVNGSEAKAPVTEKGLSRVGLGGIARRKRERIRRGRARRMTRLPRGGLAVGAYSHEVRRSLREHVPRIRPPMPRNGRVKTARQIIRSR